MFLLIPILPVISLLKSLLVYNYTISSFVKTANTISKVLRFQYIKTT